MEDLRQAEERSGQRKRSAAACPPRWDADEPRSAYYVRSAAGVSADSAGSSWMRLPDAQPSSGRVMGTGRLRQAGTGLARLGQFRSRCRAS
eukprot:1527891-Alexandrium_andersonii.AAC.1